MYALYSRNQKYIINFMLNAQNEKEASITIPHFILLRVFSCLILLYLKILINSISYLLYSQK